MSTSTSPTAILQKLHIPTHSYVAAAQAAGSLRTEFDAHKYSQAISELMGMNIVIEDLPKAQMTFGYLVQELVRSLNTSPKPMAELFDLALEKANVIIEREPWHWQTKEAAKLTRIEEVKRYVCVFRDLPRADLIDRLASDFEITKATANMYLRQLEKEDEVEQTASEPVAKKPKINKGAEATKLVQEHFNGSNKEELLKMIESKLETSRGGAQTFFYAALRQLNLSTAKQTGSKQTTQDKLKAILTANPSLSKDQFASEAEKIGVKATTAQTYYYALTSELGIERQGTGARGRRKAGGVSRLEQVAEMMKANPNSSKNELIEMLSQHFNVSKVSAQSYYYAAKKAA